MGCKRSEVRILSLRLLLLSYNTLAQEFARAERYPLCAPEFAPGDESHLTGWEQRRQALLEHILSFEADVIALQEVSRDFYRWLEPQIEMPGAYTRGSSKPNGYALFSKLEIHSTVPVKGPTGKRTAQLSRIGDYTLANCHLSWSEDGKTALLELQQLVGTDLICGDFNVDEGSEAVAWLCAQGYSHAGQGAEHPTYLAKPGSEAHIDYIFAREGLTLASVQREAVDPTGPSPSLAHPSDHRAIAAEISESPILPA
jgi:endonuclease/exonuclease/phosphatase family metal-dependent hydrolase